MIYVTTVADLRKRKVRVIKAGKRTVAVFANGSEVHALDNRCPHMGFPLHRGSLKDGILTCHWHEARFELSSGCVFDLWADDAISYATEIRGDGVWVATKPEQRYDLAYYQKRLQRGMELDIALIQTKSIASLLSSGADLLSIASALVNFAAVNIQTFGEGMIRLSCVARLSSCLHPETHYTGLSFATRQLSVEANSGPPRRARGPLSKPVETTTLKRWLRQWVLTRHRDGVERTLLTGAVSQLSRAGFADLLCGAAAERLYADGGHLFDACNKMIELTEFLGDKAPPDLLGMLSSSLANARGSEEGTSWNHPVEIASAVREAEATLPTTWKAGLTKIDLATENNLVKQLLGNDPLEIIDVVQTALVSGVEPAAIGAAITRAAGQRLARFSLSNDTSDWFNLQHTFIYCNAVHQAVRLATVRDVVRALFPAAIAVYMDRYLNIPPAKLPSETGGDQMLIGADDRGSMLLEELLSSLDHRREIEETANIVSSYLTTPFSNWFSHLGRLVDRLASATLREDLDFHCLQVLEAAMTQAIIRGCDNGTEEIMVGVARNLAAHCPTQRARYQTETIARRLQRDEDLFLDNQ